MEPVTQLKEDKKVFDALAVVAESEGGKILIKTQLKEIARVINQLSKIYRDGQHFDLVRLCAELNAALSLYQLLTKADEHSQEMDDLIKDALNE